MLCATGLSIGYVGINKIITQNYGALTIGTLALVSAVVSIVVKEAMYWYTIRAAKKLIQVHLVPMLGTTEAMH